MRRTPISNTGCPGASGNARCSGCVRVTSINAVPDSPGRARQLGFLGAVLQSHAHAFDRAGEDDLFHLALGEIAGLQLLARRGELDFLGTQHGNHLVLTTGVRARRRGHL